MAATYTYRPKKFTVKELLRMAKSHHTNLNRYIEDAIAEKISNETRGGPGHELAEKVRKIIVEHVGVQLSRPSAKEAAEIDRKYQKAEKEKNWISDEDVRFGRSKTHKR